MFNVNFHLILKYIVASWIVRQYIKLSINATNSYTLRNIIYSSVLIQYELHWQGGLFANVLKAGRVRGKSLYIFQVYI